MKSTVNATGLQEGNGHRLTRRSDGRWCKKYEGRMHYFRGSYSAALAAWKTRLSELTTGSSNLVSTRRLSAIRPSPENLDLYDPVTPESVRDLTADIRRDGVLTPLTVTIDLYILSGHRRYAAAKLAGLLEVPVIVHPIRRDDDEDEFLRLLIAHNNQRIKTFAEKLREEAASIDPAQAYRRLLSERAERSKVKLPAMVLPPRRKRSKISDAKRPMLDAVLKQIKDYGKPLSDRKLTYLLLNDPPLKNANDPTSKFINDRNSYCNLCNLLTRARLEGIIPWEAIVDETRPVTTWNVWPDAQPFIEAQFKTFLRGYWRNLQQSQPNQIEIAVEKNTVAADVRDIAGKYCIPMTSGRGFCSINPRREMAERFRKSGKSKLIILIVSDLDPSGMAIAESFANSMQDDFRIDVHAFKVGITFEQAKKYKLPHGEKAKKGRGENDGLRREFVKRYGEYVYEVEALPKGEFEKLLDRTIRGVLNIDLYNREVIQEQSDAANVEAARAAALGGMKNVESNKSTDT